MSGGAPVLGLPVLGLVVPGLPHPLLCPEKNEGWQRLRDGFAAARAEIEASGADLLLVYSTMWPSVLGHQVQARPEPEWRHVDELFHDLGTIPYRFRIDAEFAHAYVGAARERGLHARAVDHHGFPIDTGSVVALSLLTPESSPPACIVSSNVYSDRAETLVLGKAARDAIEATGRRAAVAVVMTLSNRVFTDWIDPKDDRVHSPKDDEWNRKLLEFLGAGRLEDTAQLSREIHRQIRVRKVVNFKPLWWLSAVMGQHNGYEGKVHAYEAVLGTGSAVVTLRPAAGGLGDKEFDEEDVEVFRGDRDVLAGGGDVHGDVDVDVHEDVLSSHAHAHEDVDVGVDVHEDVDVDVDVDVDEDEDEDVDVDVDVSARRSITTAAAPKPVGAYPHARRVGDLLYVSGMGPRDPATNEIPGGPVRDAAGNPLPYDVRAQTRATIANIARVLEAAGSSLADVVDVTVFLVDMDRDFADFNAVYAELLGPVGPTRTTVEVRALPTPIAVELKVIARPTAPKVP